MGKGRVDVLVCPRGVIEKLSGFVARPIATSVLSEIERSMSWMPRIAAESSNSHVQLIPATYLLTKECLSVVLERRKGIRSDLSGRFSLVVGGHIDKPSAPYKGGLSGLLSATLKRELNEELRNGLWSIRALKGLIVDDSSLTASRHVACVFETIVDATVVAAAREEYRVGQHSVNLVRPQELMGLEVLFDPWSRHLIEGVLGPMCDHGVDRAVR